MPTKDPHIALIDAQEKIHMIRAAVQTAIARVKKQVLAGQRLTVEDKQMIAAIRQEAIEQARRVQDELAEELESHGKLN